MDAMRRFYGIAAVILFALGLALWVGDSRGQQDEGAAAKAGEKLDEVGRKIKKGIEKAEDAVREGFHKTRDSVHSMGVMSRVYGRLHWDKELHSSPLTLKVEDGVVTLRGAVPTQAAKKKAVTLAAETVGVTKVIDELSVPASEADEVRTPAKP
jgi:hyperosmotically inducible protein